MEKQEKKYLTYILSVVIFEFIVYFLINQFIQGKIILNIFIVIIGIEIGVSYSLYITYCKVHSIKEIRPILDNTYHSVTAYFINTIVLGIILIILFPDQIFGKIKELPLTILQMQYTQIFDILEVIIAVIGIGTTILWTTYAGKSEKLINTLRGQTAMIFFTIIYASLSIYFTRIQDLITRIAELI